MIIKGDNSTKLIDTQSHFSLVLWTLIKILILFKKSALMAANLRVDVSCFFGSSDCLTDVMGGSET